MVGCCNASNMCAMGRAICYYTYEITIMINICYKGTSIQLTEDGKFLLSPAHLFPNWIIIEYVKKQKHSQKKKEQ